MKIQKKNGFALVLSLVLLLVMSLLGGSLIVITSGDHSSNNTSDQYQQTFYVAETGLIEAEKAIVNEYLGPWINLANLDTIQASMTQEEREAHNEYVAANTVDGSHFRDKDNRAMPGNGIEINETPCFKSFRNIVILEDDPSTGDVDESIFKVAIQVRNNNFGNMLAPILASLEVSRDDDPDTADVDEKSIGEASVQSEIDKEMAYMRRFIYEYFVVNVGTSTYKGTGSSVKKSATDEDNIGTAYKVYSCGMFLDSDGDTTDPEILIPLESLLVMPN
tara:strand:+ start:39 stop:869 length:831 start_codon:yes stop_codon:yes gene_type:complete